MIDASSEGIRCRATREIRSNSGMIASSSEGIIQYEIENHGHKLIRVHWDNGLSLNVSPSEIEIIDGTLLWQ